MEELKLLKHARHYIASMAEGINPLNGEFAPDTDTISQERIQKCCSYVAEILDKVIKNGGTVGRQRQSKVKFSISPEQLRRVKISDEPIGINEVAKRINDAADNKNMRGISGAKIASWLAQNGYLSVEEIKAESIKTKKVLNERSAALGITMTKGVKTSTGEVYDKLLYNAAAQRFIINNIKAIAGGSEDKID